MLWNPGWKSCSISGGYRKEKERGPEDDTKEIKSKSGCGISSIEERSEGNILIGGLQDRAQDFRQNMKEKKKSLVKKKVGVRGISLPYNFIM